MRLRTKLLLFFLPLVLLSVASMTQLARQVVQGIVEEQVAKRGISVAAGIAQDPDIVVGLWNRDEEWLIPPLQTVLRQTQALYAAVLDPQGQVLAHTDVSETGKVYSDSITTVALRAERALAQRSFVEGQPVVDIAFPMWDDQRAYAAEEFLLLGEDNFAGMRRLGTLRFALPLTDAIETGRA
jgi:sensor histidine kinase regulating citrate/malate metabolism